jgi:O-antigen ligase
MSAWSSQRRGLALPRRWLGAWGSFGFYLVLFLGAMLFLRVLIDDTASSNSRQSGNFDFSGAIAVVFIVVAAGLLLRRHRGVLPTALATLWLCVWTAIAVGTRGASTETLREGVREVSVIGLAVIVYNARGAVTTPIAARLVQLIGFVPALIAVYQLATHTGMDIGRQIRANGTFAHPDSAAMFFAIAATVSLWLYFEHGKRWLDASLTTLFTVALIATFSIDGLATLTAMLVSLGGLRSGSLGDKLVPCVIAGVVVLVFFATPLGARRITSESSTIATVERGESSTSLAWRLQKWKTLLPEWEQSPLFGRGLGTTTTEDAIPGNRFAGYPPHNEYVRYTVETGIVGLIVLLSALTILIRCLIRKRQIPGISNAGTRNAATLALVIVIGCLVDSLADNTFLNSPTCYAAALIVAAALAQPGVSGARTT